MLVTKPFISACDPLTNDQVGAKNITYNSTAWANTKYVVGTTATVECIHDYVLMWPSNDTVLRCIDNNTWSSTPPRCVES